MKKIFAIVLAVAMIACLTVSVSAADSVGRTDTITHMPNSSSQTINVTLVGDDVGSSSAGTVYSVTVAWEAANLEFNVTNATNTGLVWNPTTHTYDVQTESTVEGNWVAGKDIFDVTITNHSNAAVVAELVLPATTGITDATFSAAVNGTPLYTTNEETATGMVATLQSADVEGQSLYNPAKAPTITYTITAEGTPKASFSIATNVELRQP